VVGLTWPPGMRQRGFEAEAADTGAALALLAERIQGYLAALA